MLMFEPIAPSQEAAETTSTSTSLYSLEDALLLVGKGAIEFRLQAQNVDLSEADISRLMDADILGDGEIMLGEDSLPTLQQCQTLFDLGLIGCQLSVMPEAAANEELFSRFIEQGQYRNPAEIRALSMLLPVEVEGVSFEQLRVYAGQFVDAYESELRQSFLDSLTEWINGLPEDVLKVLIAALIALLYGLFLLFLVQSGILANIANWVQQIASNIVFAKRVGEFRDRMATLKDHVAKVNNRPVLDVKPPGYGGDERSFRGWCITIRNTLEAIDSIVKENRGQNREELLKESGYTENDLKELAQAVRDAIDKCPPLQGEFIIPSIFQLA